MTFRSRETGPEQQEASATLAGDAEQLLQHIHKVVPPGRYQSLAITSLEQAIMWANKGITHDSAVH